MAQRSAREEPGWRNFQHPVAFWFGVSACTIGVLLHLPMYIQSRSMGYRMVGMTPDPAMIIGMVLIGVGLVTSLYGLLPRGVGSIRRRAESIRVGPLDDTPIRPQHVALLVVMSLAVTIDNMKPITLSFVAPGVAKEYGLKSPANPHGHLPVSLLPLCGITGTVIGALLWGALADRIGRRASILYAGILFVTTAICGAMPGFTWNLVMCFFMGMAAGGLLPIAVSLLSEIIPARHRGWLMVLVGGNVAGAYAITSWLAGALTPTYSWRILWLTGIPTGLLLLALNRWIPESPRYLLAIGKPEAAREVMARYGAKATTVPEPSTDLAADAGFTHLFRRPFTLTTLAVLTLALGTGLVAYGFQLWIPTNLQHLGFTAVNSDYVIRNAALLGLPFIAAVAWMYDRSTRVTIVVLSLLTTLTLLVFAVLGDSLSHHRLLLSVLLVVPLSAISAVVAVLAAYSAEIYPTRIRSRGAGLVSGTTKIGGVMIIGVVAAATTIPSIPQTALIGVLPFAIATLVFLRTGPQTNRRTLEEITALAPSEA